MFNAKDITVENLDAESIVNGTLSIGKNYEGIENNGVLKIYDFNDNLIVEISGSEGVRVFDDNGFMNTQIAPNKGIQGFFREANGKSHTLYGIITDETSSDQVFFAERLDIGEYANLGKMQIKYMDNGTNAGIAFVPRI